MHRLRIRTTAPARASAVVLAPALLLVLLALAAVAVDLSLVHSAHRGVHRIVSAAADDAAGLVDGHHLQTTGEIRIDESAAAELVRTRLRHTDLPGELIGQPVVTVDRSSGRVTVRAVVDVGHPVTRSLRSGRVTTRLDVTAAGRMTP